MTFKEKWELDHPGRSWKDDHTCPRNSEGELITCIVGKDCLACWDQEIPEKGESKIPDILYICDRKQCENCTAPELCRYTTDIAHAKNFSYDGVADMWYEDPRKTKED